VELYVTMYMWILYGARRYESQLPREMTRLQTASLVLACITSQLHIRAAFRVSI
jgi:hypothetical protein